MRILGTFCILVVMASVCTGQIDTTYRELTSRETELYRLIMEYRAGKTLPAISLSPSMTKVAQVHVRDLNANPPESGCGMHSWSSDGPWESVCYNKSGNGPGLMWCKPSELTPYKGRGYEIAYSNTDTSFTPKQALDSWKASPGHNSVIVNLGMWKNSDWKAVGLAIEGNYAVVWFGVEKDPAGSTNQP